MSTYVEVGRLLYTRIQYYDTNLDVAKYKVCYFLTQLVIGKVT